MIQPSESTADQLAIRLQVAFRPTTRGVVGLVDDLLDLCREHQLRIQFNNGHCSVHQLGAEHEEIACIPVQKSVFRAALARIAAICQEQHPETVTPYHGAGEILIPATTDSALPRDPSTCHCSYTNTASEQTLELRFARQSLPSVTRFTVLLRDNRTVIVYGHALKYIPGTSSSGDGGSYGILAPESASEVFVAMFPVSAVAGVFHGELGNPEQVA